MNGKNEYQKIDNFNKIVDLRLDIVMANYCGESYQTILSSLKDNSIILLTSNSIGVSSKYNEELKYWETRVDVNSIDKFSSLKIYAMVQGDLYEVFKFLLNRDRVLLISKSDSYITDNYETVLDTSNGFINVSSVPLSDVSDLYYKEKELDLNIGSKYSH